MVQQNQYVALCKVLERPDLATDPRFVDVRSRRAHSQALTALLSIIFAGRAASDWEARLSAVGIPCGMVRDVGAACDLAQLDLRGLKQKIRIPGLPESEDVHILNAGFLFAHDGPGMSEPPPALGAHTEAILASLTPRPLHE